MATARAPLALTLITATLALPGAVWAQTPEQTIETLRQQVEQLTQKVNALSAVVRTTPVTGLQAARDLEFRVSGDSEWSTGKKLVLTAQDSVLIRTGAASIEMRKDGSIRIQGGTIDILGSGAVNVKASNDIVLKGSKIRNN